MRIRAWCVVVALAFAAAATAADFGTPGGPAPANVDAISQALRKDPYDLELLISFGTSKGGSAGHLALAIRDPATDDDVVYSANFYADRAPEHAGRYNEDLMLAIPKKEYLFGTTSSLGEKAAFGLDYGEIYKRSVIGVRVRGVSAREKEALAAFFRRINEDYRRRAEETEYHDDEIRYGYLHLNCAKTIGAAFRHGAGYGNLEIASARFLSGLRVVAAVNANIPTEMAVKLIREWSTRGYAMDVVLYRKYEGSGYVDPLEEEKVAFRDLPNRFPSVLSRDFRREEGRYEDYDNLYAMYLLHNMGRYSIRVNARTKLLEIEKTAKPLPYGDADARAARSAHRDSENARGGRPFRPSGTAIGERPDDAYVDVQSDVLGRTAP